MKGNSDESHILIPFTHVEEVTWVLLILAPSWTAKEIFLILAFIYSLQIDKLF